MADTLQARDPDFDNLMSPANIADPFPLYRTLRCESPVHWSKHFSTWTLTRYADVRSVLGDHERFSSAIGEPLRQHAKNIPDHSRADFDLGMRFFYGQVQAMDAPAHTVQRALISKAFTPRVMANIRESIQTRIDFLLEAMAGQQEVDFVRDFAYPLPSLIIFDLLGIPEQHYDLVRSSAAGFARFPPAVFTGNYEALESIGRNLRTTETVLLQLVAERRATPQNDLLSSLAAEQDGVSLSDADIAVLANFLLFAGHETTANLLSGSLIALLSERRHWEYLSRNPSAIPPAVEELLRFVSPVLTVSRLLRTDVTLHGTEMKAGQRVQLLIGAANHDSDEFERADEFNPGRTRPHSIAFGQGAHYCIGAALARLEAQLALSTLLVRFPNLQLVTSQVEYQPVFFLRSPKALMVKTRP